jgi:hypothetical protein
MMEEYQQPVNEEQQQVDEQQKVDEEQYKAHDRHGDMEDDDDDTPEDDYMDRKPAALNMGNFCYDDREDGERENVAQFAIAEEPSVILPSLPPLHAALTQSISQLVAYVVDNVAHSTSAIVDNDITFASIDPNVQLVTSIADNVSQSTSALVDSNTTTTECVTALAINTFAASLLHLAQLVRKRNVPSFICQSLCI